MPNPSVNVGTLFAAGSSTNTGSTGGITPVGNVALIQVIVQANVYVTSITDTAGDTNWVSAIGSYNNANSKGNLGSFYFSAFYCYATITGSANAVTVNLSGNSGSTFLIAYYDCTNIAASSPFTGGIYNLQSTVANGTNAITVAGGNNVSNGDNITFAPSLVCTLGEAGGGTITPGTSPITFTSVATSGTNRRMEYGVAAGTGTFDSTFTLAGGATPTCLSWQIALAGQSGVSLPILGQLVM
jgi:hypothetical protein